MFVTSNQFYVLCASISFGVLSGVLYQVVIFVKRKLNNIAKIIVDVVVFLLFAFLFVFYAYYFNFPNFRFYMPLCVFLGIYLGGKSFGIILAKIIDWVYNIIRKKFKGKLKNDRKQV